MPKNTPQTDAPALVLIVGYSDSGKTTALEKLIPEFTRRGYRVGTIKHHHSSRLELDKPGKDSWRHKAAGAATAVVCSSRRIGMVKDIDADPGLEGLLALFAGLDIVLCEGYKTAACPKVEVFRRQSGNSPVCRDDPRLLATIGDRPLETRGPYFSWTESSQLCEFLIGCLLTPSRAPDVKKKSQPL